MKIVGQVGRFKELLIEGEKSVWGEYEGKYAKVVEFYQNEDYTELIVKFIEDGKELTITGEEFELL